MSEAPLDEPRIVFRAGNGRPRCRALVALVAGVVTTLISKQNDPRRIPAL